MEEGAEDLIIKELNKQRNQIIGDVENKTAIYINQHYNGIINKVTQKTILKSFLHV